MKFMYRLKNYFAPSYLSDLLSKARNINVNYDLRSSENLSRLKCRTQTFLKSLLPDGVRQWNSVSPEVRGSNTLQNLLVKLSAVLRKILCSMATTED